MAYSMSAFSTNWGGARTCLDFTTRSSRAAHSPQLRAPAYDSPKNKNARSSIHQWTCTPEPRSNHDHAAIFHLMAKERATRVWPSTPIPPADAVLGPPYIDADAPRSHAIYRCQLVRVRVHHVEPADAVCTREKRDAAAEPGLIHCEQFALETCF